MQFICKLSIAYHIDECDQSFSEYRNLVKRMVKCCYCLWAPDVHQTHYIPRYEDSDSLENRICWMDEFYLSRNFAHLRSVPYVAQLIESVAKLIEYELGVDVAVEYLDDYPQLLAPNEW